MVAFVVVTQNWDTHKNTPRVHSFELQSSEGLVCWQRVCTSL